MTNFLSSNLAHLIPLIIATSVVYGATRDDRPGKMVEQMIRSAVWMGVVLGGITLILIVLGHMT